MFLCESAGKLDWFDGTFFAKKCRQNLERLKNQINNEFLFRLFWLIYSFPPFFPLLSAPGKQTSPSADFLILYPNSPFLLYFRHLIERFFLLRLFWLSGDLCCLRIRELARFLGNFSTCFWAFAWRFRTYNCCPRMCQQNWGNSCAKIDWTDVLLSSPVASRFRITLFSTFTASCLVGRLPIIDPLDNCFLLNISNVQTGILWKKWDR